MKKLINAAGDVVSESLAGFCAAHSDIVRLGDQAPFVQRRHLKSGKVALVSGGGSGHEPLHTGFVGYGMLDAACPGQVFTSPTPDLILAAAEAVDTGAGVLFIVKNYEGDAMNFDMGAYSVYIWPAYGISALALAGITLWTLAAWRRAKARLAALEKRPSQT